MPQAVGGVGWKNLKEVPPPPPEPAADRSPATVARVVYLVAGLYALTFAMFSILLQDTFRTNAFDLGNMDQAVWNTYQGRWFAFTNWEGGLSRLAAHVEPLLILIAQSYHIYSSPKTLLALQAGVLSLGALPVFWLARQRLRSDFAGAVFAFAYLLTPSLQAAVLADFHAVTLSATFLLFAFYFLQKRWYPAFLFVAVLAMATKEEIPLSVFLMGLYAAFIQKDRAWGLATAALALVWAGVAFGIVIPSFNPAGSSPYLARYDYLVGPGNSGGILGMPGQALATVLDGQRRAYLDGLVRPLLYLPILSPFTLLLALPDLGINLLSNFPFQYSSRVHYDAPIIPFMAISAVFGVQLVARAVARISRPWFRPTAIILSAGVLVSSLYGYSSLVFLPLTDHMPTVTEHTRLAEVFTAMIPPQAPVSAGSALNPHVSQRQALYLFPEVKDSEYIFLDVTADAYPIDGPSQRYVALGLLKEGEWGIVAADDGLLLLGKGKGTASFPDRFFNFARVQDPEIPYPMDLTFGPLRFLGYDVEPRGSLHGRDPYATFTLYWQALEPPKKDYQIAVFLISPSNSVVASLNLQPTTTWYPTSQWRPGETVKVVVSKVPMAGYRQGEVQLGVADGTDINSMDQRVRPNLTRNFDPASLNGDQTLARLRTLNAD
ncbi:MAG: DUF2079 domain-containing protein [Dehalococcoidia bacterium]|nr:DUF2079 domain-containing protein [Dehalococcoidia bacterium]